MSGFLTNHGLVALTSTYVIHYDENDILYVCFVNCMETGDGDLMHVFKYGNGFKCMVFDWYIQGFGFGPCFE